MKEKTLIFLVAENCAGKSSVARELQECFAAKLFSMREVIYTEMRYQGFTDEEIQTRGFFKEFCEGMKKNSHPAFFIKQAAYNFLDRKESVGIIESIRCPGEAAWVNEMKRQYEDLTICLIGITAPKVQRLKRFTQRDLQESLAKENTMKEFVRQEILVNSGIRPWEENVQKTMEYAHLTVENPDGGLDECVKKIKEYLF